MKVKNIRNVLSKGKFQERLYYKVISNLASEKAGFSRFVYSSLNAVLIPSQVRKAIERLKKSEKNHEFDIMYSEIKKKYQEMPKNTYSKTLWKTLCSYFISEGLFTLGYIARTKAKEYIQMDKEANFEKVLLAIEEGKIDKLDLLIDNLEKKYLVPVETINLMKDLSNLLNDKPCVFNVDSEFEAFIKGKDCHIVGPTVTSNTIKNDVFYCSENLLIRNNVKLDHQRKLIKSNVSYCNGDGISKILDSFDEYVNYFDYVVVKHEEKRVDGSKIHRAVDATDVLFMGEANMLPIMVMDLKINGCNRIYVSGNNLFFSKTAHSKEYMISVSTQHLIKSFAVHDMISQHSFLKLLYKNSIIIPDEELKRVLDLETIEYLEKMESLYRIN